MVSTAPVLAISGRCGLLFRFKEYVQTCDSVTGDVDEKNIMNSAGFAQFRRGLCQ